MKVPDLLKTAVEAQDWKLVCAVYTAITGEPLSPPEPKKPTLDLANFDISPELLEQLGITHSLSEFDSPRISEIPYAGDDLPYPAEVDIQLERKKKDNAFITQAQKKSGLKVNEEGKAEAVKQPIAIPKQGERPNAFNDDLSLESQHLKENIDPKLYQNFRRVKRESIEDAVDTGGEIRVQCSLCHTDEIVAAALSVGYNPDPKENTYKCNSCCTPAGRTRALRKTREEELSGGSIKRR